MVPMPPKLQPVTSSLLSWHILLAECLRWDRQGFPKWKVATSVCMTLFMLHRQTTSTSGTVNVPDEYVQHPSTFLDADHDQY